MFTKAFLDALIQGTPARRSRLSLRDVKEIATDRLYGMQNAPKPIVLSPDQSEGDIADIPFFPNPQVEEERLHKAEEGGRMQQAESNIVAQVQRGGKQGERSSLSASKIVLLIVLVLLIVGAGSVLYLRMAPLSGQPQLHASPTTQAPQVATTPSAQTPQALYAQVTQGTPTLDDPLSTNDTNNWTETTSADGKFSCAFSGGVYHASAPYMLCLAQATNFGDLAYQVQMTIVKGEFGGMVFRADGSQSKYYSFFIDRSGNYTLITSVDNTGHHDHVLHNGTSAFIRTGLNQVNLLTVIARGSNIYLYINQHYITSASDTAYRAGQIGVFGGNASQAPADVVFSHAQVWKV